MDFQGGEELCRIYQELCPLATMLFLNAPMLILEYLPPDRKEVIIKDQAVTIGRKTNQAARVVIDQAGIYAKAR